MARPRAILRAGTLVAMLGAPRGWLVALALVALACGGEPRPPLNAVIICLDTVRFDAFHLSEKAGLQDPLSPWLEKALRFRRAYSPAPWTLPAVASLLTGRYPNWHGAGSYLGTGTTLDKRLPPPLRSDVPTLAERLRSRGYLTRGVVAQSFFHPKFGLRRGFETMDFHTEKPGQVRLIEKHFRELAAIPVRPPFLFYLHFMEAHREHMRPEAEREELLASMPEALRRAGIDAAPGSLCRDLEGPTCRSWLTYLNSIRKLRERVAGILAELDERGWLEQSVVLLYSDHGEEFHDHREEQERRGTDSRRIFGFGHGQSLYQELLHIPLVVWHPDEPGRDVERQVNLVDVAPSLASWLDQDLDLEWDGRRLLSDTETEPRSLFASEVAFGPRETTVIRENWKRIRRTQPDERLLFDLRADPGESTPLSNPEVERELDDGIAAYESSARSNEASNVALSPEEVEALRELGYVQDLEEE